MSKYLATYINIGGQMFGYQGRRTSNQVGWEAMRCECHHFDDSANQEAVKKFAAIMTFFVDQVRFKGGEEQFVSSCYGYMMAKWLYDTIAPVRQFPRCQTIRKNVSRLSI